MKKVLLVLSTIMCLMIIYPSFATTVVYWQDWNWREHHHHDWMEWREHHHDEWNDWRRHHHGEWGRWHKAHPDED